MAQLSLFPLFCFRCNCTVDAPCSERSGFSCSPSISSSSRSRARAAISSGGTSTGDNNNNNNRLCEHYKMNREELQSLSCKMNGGCSSSTPKLTEEKKETLLREYPLWRRETTRTSVITRKFTAKNWQAASDFFSELSKVAEEEGHITRISK